MDSEALLFSLLQAVICGKSSEGLAVACTEEALDAAYALAKPHDLAHLVGQAVAGMALPASEILETCKKTAMSAFLRQVQQEQVFTQLSAAFEEAAIPFIPLKGLILRAYYPQPWLRTSSDLDILVHQENLERATRILTENLGYTYCKTSSHDVAFRSPQQVYLELHYSTIEDFISPAAAQVMGAVWEQATPATGHTYQLQLPDALFYYYHIAHAAKHFLGGGCGIRVFMDIWVLENCVPHDRTQREALLARGGMLPFAQAAEALSRHWFDSAQADDMTTLLGQFILSGGNFGTLQNRVSINQSRRGGKLRYALSRIFLPYGILQYHYPILQKHKLLFPLYQVVRWCKLLFCGGATRSMEELQTNAGVTPEQKETASVLLNYLQLQ
ncbi:MAG: nucleotidyltransferase family protein [Oscillospiraceae bacterium]|nr:nucleotidyltransferase family protein [Oscillospiraceae bacterium]